MSDSLSPEIRDELHTYLELISLKFEKHRKQAQHIKVGEFLYMSTNQGPMMIRVLDRNVTETTTTFEVVVDEVAHSLPIPNTLRLTFGANEGS